MNTTVIGVVVVLIIVVALAGLYYYLRQRSERLHRRFGPEYDRAVSQYGDKKKAEAELVRRARRVERFHIREINADERNRFAAAWKAEQSRFVDAPEQAVAQAHRLVGDLMHARGYPVSEEFEQNADDLSVDHPNVVDHYRRACEIAGRRENGSANTEDLRAAMVHYRELFEDLLGRPVKEPEEVRR